MRARQLGAYFSVSVSRDDVMAFKRRWPASGLPDRAVTFVFQVSNGDLVDISPRADLWDGAAAVALAEDAQAYGARRLRLNV